MNNQIKRTFGINTDRLNFEHKSIFQKYEEDKRIKLLQMPIHGSFEITSGDIKRLQSKRKDWLAEEDDTVKNKILELSRKIPKNSIDIGQIFINCYDELITISDNKLQDYLLQFYDLAEIAKLIEIYNSKMYGYHQAESKIIEIVNFNRQKILELILLGLKIIAEEDSVGLGGFEF